MAQEQLRITVRLRDFATRSLQRISGTLNRMRRTILSAKTALVGLATGFVAKNIIEYTGRVEGVESAFKSLTQTVGQDFNRVLQALRAGTRGTVSDFKLMQNANTALQLGVAKTAEDFFELTELSRRLGKAVGRDATDAFQDLVTGIGRGSKLILDNLGITVDGVVTLEKVIAAARKRVNGLGDDSLTLGEAFGQLKTEVANLATELLKALGPTFKNAIEGLTGFIRNSKPAILNFLADAIEGFKFLKDAILDAITSLGSLADFAGISPAARLNEATSELQRSLGAVFQGFGKENFEERIGRARLFNKGTPELERIEKAKIAFDEARRAYDAFLRLTTSKAAASPLTDAAAALRAAARESAAAPQRFAPSDEFVGPPQANTAGFKSVFDVFRKTETQQVLGKEIETSTGLISSLTSAARSFGTTAQEAFVSAGAATGDFLSKVKSASEEQKKLKDAVMDAGAGATAALRQLAEEGTKFGLIAGQAVLDVASALETNATNALTAFITGTKSAKEAFKDFARSVFEDITRIIARLLVLQAISRLSGGLISLNVGGTRHGGGFIPESGLYNLQRGERVVSPARPVVSGSGRGEAATFSGSGGGRVVIQQYLTFNVPPNATEEQAEFIKRTVAEAVNSETEFRDAIQPA